jgi:hypothetical protein
VLPCLAAATDLVQVRYSLTQLEQADAWVAAQLERLTPSASNPVHLSAGYQTDLNRVVIGMAGHGLTPAERSLISRVKQRFGDLVQLVQQPAGTAAATPLDCVASRDDCSAPLRGGVEIFRVNAQNQRLPGQCTAGFIASSRTDGKLYVITAGHCAAEAGTGTWAARFPDGSVHVVGAVHRYDYGTGGDEAILNINNPSGWKLPQGWVYVKASPNTTLNDQYPITSAQYSTLGARVCETGATTGTVCGTVVALGRTVCVGPSVTSCRWIANLGEAGFRAGQGDSGGSVYAAHQAFGLVSAGATDNLHGGAVTYYQGINGALNAMNVNIVHGTAPTVSGWIGSLGPGVTVEPPSAGWGSATVYGYMNQLHPQDAPLPCQYIAPSSQSTCRGVLNTGAQNGSFVEFTYQSIDTGYAAIDGNEALVVFDYTGACLQVGIQFNCPPNNTDTAALLDSGQSFSELWTEVTSEARNEFQLIPLLKVNGKWYVDYSKFPYPKFS